MSINNLPTGFLVVEAGILISEFICMDIYESGPFSFLNYIAGLIFKILSVIVTNTVTFSITAIFIPSLYSIIYNTKLNVVILLVGILVFVGGEGLAVAVNYGFLTQKKGKKKRLNKI